jgi:leucine efflux protein
MFGIADYGAFVVAIIVFLAIPGPGNLALITSTSKGGIAGGWLPPGGDRRRPGPDVDGGGWCGGLAAAYPAAFHAVQWLGAAYLAWLGSACSRQAGCAPVLNIQPRHYFKQALLITLLNPKAIVFYMAFFPLFVDPARHQGLLTFGVMALTIAVLTFAYGLVAVAAHALSGRAHARQPGGGRVLKDLAGVFLIGFGVKLALSK